MDTPAKSQPQGTRHRILHLLKVRGPRTTRQLAEALALSSMGIRQHLISLEGSGWVRRHLEQRGVGRPQFVYALTEHGDEQSFPRAYASEMNGLLRAIEELDGAAGLDKVFEERTQQLASAYRARISSDDLEERVRALTSIRTEEGFMAEWEKNGEDTFILHEHNCAVYQVASSCDQVCFYEQELFCRVLDGADVTRISHILSGEPRCTYLIQRTG